MGQRKQANQILCGFAMETSDLILHAKEKLEKKNCDMIVANHLKTAGAGFQGDTNVVTMITQDDMLDYGLMSKEELAYVILETLMDLEGQRC